MKKAFTMLELVFVLVVIGILAAVMLPDMKSSKVAESAVQLQSHIRYAQHLAMVDDKFDAGNNVWFKDRWQIDFTGNTYSIGSDDGATFAVDSLNRDQNLSAINLNDDYGVTLNFGAGCGGANAEISFDHMGRPMIGDTNAWTQSYTAGSLMVADCLITISMTGETSVVLTIRPETGYVSGI
ncbi:protein containing N-terminal methylation domain [Sulfurimonas gotlandica GD1]|uniref:Protein containing N-terminal methylation domain n=1 Tax=Sulfurimonas gotlandica (strain DSM 19862 / JCM 16533 / GD1) TaxID=929558 RepID=B6BL57_SULGG|nr:prepilin-type N-terminal cleavage/methylation domain-containing protein [Sulfurimonas gotlandica]EDZ62175.1 N-terminal methylation protein [Sulfurimonas gotlandica GD1]EHP28794.1 protein containing N-terminal methylation domain [Sulfurimonas gotlandica GD1]